MSTPSESTDPRTRETPSSDTDLSNSSLPKAIRKLGHLADTQNLRAAKDVNAWFKSLDVEEFQAVLVRVNGILRDSPIAGRSIDGDTVAVRESMGGVDMGASHIPPRDQDKPSLISEMLDRAQACSDLKDAALVVYYGLQCIHPFADGNGRTGRAFALLLEHASDDKVLDIEGIAEIVVHQTENDTEGRESFAKQVRPARVAQDLACRHVIAKDLLNENALPLAKRAYLAGANFAAGDDIDNASITPETKRALKSCIEGFESFSPAALALIRFIDAEMPDRGIYSIRGSEGQEFLNIDAEVVLSEINQEQAERLIEMVWQAKSEAVSTLMRIIAFPETGPSWEGQDGETLPLKHFFRAA